MSTEEAAESRRPPPPVITSLPAATAMAFFKRLSQNFTSYMFLNRPRLEDQTINHNVASIALLGQKRKRVSSPASEPRTRKLLKYDVGVEAEDSILNVGDEEAVRSLEQSEFEHRHTSFSSPCSGGCSATPDEVLESIEYSHIEDDPDDDDEFEDDDDNGDGGEEEEDQIRTAFEETAEDTDDQNSEQSLLGEGDTSILDQRSFNLTFSNSQPSLSSPLQVKVHGPEDIGRPELATDVLLASGWTPDAITLMHRIVLRGYEPLLPAYMKFENKLLPDGLFALDSASAFLSASSSASDFRASKAFERFVDISSRARDCITSWTFLTEQFPNEDRPEPEPELVIRAHLRRYYAFLLSDAGLSRRHGLPLLTMTFGVGHVTGKDLRLAAQRKCARLAARWRAALHDKNLDHPAGPTESINYPMPTLYALACSWAVVVLYRYDARQPNEPWPITNSDTGAGDAADGLEPECQSMAIFDLGKSNNDVWDALALACVGCHVRNVGVRIAQETGIGRAPRDGDDVEDIDDPDA